ncbi:MAG: uroporphyrinogen decarboxylase family protein, partial [candidate division WOR-3 bacterium]|nr:uroporphyrinogen decarboxylase family protein [candidate division WOR-3 bacterium]
PNSYRKDPSHIKQTEAGQTLKDEWRVTWRKPEKGLYFDPVQYPLAGDLSINDVYSFPWPNPVAKQLFEGLTQQAENAYTSGYAVLMEDFGAGILEQALRLRGYSQFYMDLVANTPLACRILDKILELKIKYWEHALKKMGKYVQIIRYGDDLGGQDKLLISPKTYRKILKPRQKELFTFLKRNFPDIYIMFHSDGAIYEIVPDLIEIGADILNPVQLSAQGMEAKSLKKNFGDSITFWGAGVDTQRTLPGGTSKEIKEEVKERIDLLAPGGGFVFGTVHNIQDDVPPENVMAMWDTLQEAGQY